MNSPVVTFVRIPLNIQSEKDRRQFERIVERIWRNQHIYDRYDAMKTTGKSHTWIADEISAELDMARSHVNAVLSASGRKAKNITPKLIKASLK